MPLSEGLAIGCTGRASNFPRAATDYREGLRGGCLPSAAANSQGMMRSHAPLGATIDATRCIQPREQSWEHAVAKGHANNTSHANCLSQWI
jgi:hypothetical protein